MFLRRSAILLLFLLAFTGMCKETNLVINSDFAANPNAFPPYWTTLNHGGARVDYLNVGGPEGRGFVRLTTTGRPARLQQMNLTLVQGEKYRLGAWIRTRGVVNKASGIRVGAGSYPEQKHNCLAGLPANQLEWKYYEKEITLPDTVQPLYPYYTIDIVLEPGGGTLDVTGVVLYPVTEKARLASKSQMATMTPCLVPLGWLHYIPESKPVMDFFWVGTFPGDPDNAICQFTFSKNRKTVTAPFSLKRFRVDFSGAAESGKQELQIKILSKSSKAVLFEETYPIRVMSIPEITPNAKSLNNLVTEIYNQPVPDGTKVQVANPRYGFVLFRFIPDGNQKFAVTLNGEQLFDQTAWQSETIRVLEPGNYQVAVAGAKGNLVIRLIPDVLTFALWTPRMPGNGKYDWEFAKKHIFPGLTTLNIGEISPTNYAEMKAMGRQFLENYGIQNWQNPNIAEDNLKRMQKDRVFKNLHNDGTTMDEAECQYPVMLDPYAWALKRFANPNNKLIVTYQTGAFSPAFLNQLSAASNASQGRSWLAMEIYPRGQKTLADMQNMIHNTAQQWDILRDIAPGLFSKVGVAWGNFSCPPNQSLAHYPHIDYKYVLDMKMHAIANHPSFKGVGKVGFWGSYAADEEVVRWSFKLMRHYAFEGKKEMLSDKYGFTLIPGYLQNCDFTDGLRHWQSTGDVSVDSFPGYGYKSIRLHGSEGAGDTFALLRRHPNQVAEVRQTATGLTKGKKYLLYFYVGDYDDVIQKRQRPGALPLDVTLTGAKILQKVHYTGNNTKAIDGAAFVNIHKLIFEAESENVELRFSNREAAAGSALMLNYICLRPYFEEEN